LYQSRSAPREGRGFVPQVLETLSKIFRVDRPGRLRNFLAATMRWCYRRPAAARALERVEFAIKAPVFGCQACGNCLLSHMEYVCPQTCPKGMRNGPCGGTQEGRCEVVDKPCIWIAVYERAKSSGRMSDLQTYIPPRNLALQGTSSWINYFLNRDNRPGNEFVSIEGSREASTADHRAAERREASKAKV
jgi:Methylene-tetrahydrofolate reductase C terminal